MSQQRVSSICTDEEAEAVSREDFPGSGRKSRAGSGKCQKKKGGEGGACSGASGMESGPGP